MSRLGLRLLGTVGFTLLLAAGCSDSSNSNRPASGPNGAPTYDVNAFQIVSGSENESLKPILDRFAKEKGVDLRVQFKGSIDIMLDLDQGKAIAFDAVWPANSLWISLGDTQKIVKSQDSIMTSPVVFGVKESVAKRLGWIGKEVKMADILKAAEAGQFSFAMTSATQSNSGATAYLGFLHALAGSPDVLTSKHLADPKVQEKIKALLGHIDRSSGSSGWLKRMVVENYDKFQAMVNYEALIIEANQKLVADGKEPLIAIYPADGICISDSPLGYVDHGSPEKEKIYKDLVAYLKSDAVQKEIIGLGRRAGLVGFDAKNADPAVFNPAWGIDVNRVIAPIPLPKEDVLREALDLYQAGGLRKPSATIYALDCSGSMEGKGISQLKQAMTLLLDPVQSKKIMIQPSARDIHIIVPFDAEPREKIVRTGNDPQTLKELLGNVQRLRAGGGTDIYAAVIGGLRELKKLGPMDGYFPAVILMTDGQSDGSIESLRLALQAQGYDVPVYSITFGEADERQLQDIARLSGGQVFDGRKDMAKAFREAKGYN
jgi:Ca-activated chloride channel homolog